MRHLPLRYGNPACLVGSRDREDLSSILKTVFMLSENHIGIPAAFYLLNCYFSTALQLLGSFILPRLHMKNSENYFPVCSKSKVMIRYIENTNSRYFNYFCFPTALFW